MALARRRRNPNIRPIWVAGIAGVAILLVGGIAYAASNKGSSGCKVWTKAISNAEALKTAINQQYNVNLDNMGDSVNYYSVNGQQVRFVANMGGSLNAQYPDSYNSDSFYVCTG